MLNTCANTCGSDEPRVSNGQTVGEYLDYLFGSTREGGEASAPPSIQGDKNGLQKQAEKGQEET